MLISVIVTLILIGLLMYIVDLLIPMDATIRKVIRIVVLVAVCLWLLQVFGVWNGMGLRIGQSETAITQTYS